MSQKRFENFPKALPSRQRASIFTVVKGEVVTQRAKPLTIVKILAMTAGRERPKEYLMNLKLRQICVHLIGGDTKGLYGCPKKSRYYDKHGWQREVLRQYSS